MLDDLRTELEQLRHSIKSARIGKVLPDAFYVSRISAEALNAPFFTRLAGEIKRQQDSLFKNHRHSTWNVFKVSKSKSAFSMLTYEDPEESAFPELLSSTSVNLEKGKVLFQDYRPRTNRFILHRKELLFVGGSDQTHEWSELTRQCEMAGLFEEPRRIGTSTAWKQLLLSKGLTIEGQRLRKVQEQQ